MTTQSPAALKMGEGNDLPWMAVGLRDRRDDWQARRGPVRRGIGQDQEHCRDLCGKSQFRSPLWILSRRERNRQRNRWAKDAARPRWQAAAASGDLRLLWP